MRYFLIALTALTLSAPMSFATEGDCGCSSDCQAKCEKGPNAECKCEGCECAKGHCKHGKCAAHKKSKKKAAAPAAAPAEQKKAE